MPLIPVNALVPIFRESGFVTIERPVTPTVNEFGEVVLGTPTLIEAVIAAHQATRKQIERAGLDYTLDWRTFYSETELRVADSPELSDVILYQNERWELHARSDFETLGGLYIAFGRRTG